MAQGHYLSAQRNAFPGRIYNPYATGQKVYGAGRSFPTMGPVDPAGYKERDAAAKMKRNALLRRLQAKQQGNFASPDFLRYKGT